VALESKGGEGEERGRSGADHSLQIPHSTIGVPSSTPRHEQNSSSDLFAFTFRAGFLEAAFSLAFIVDEGREGLPFSLPGGCVVTLRERVVRMLAAAAAAVAARVGMWSWYWMYKVRRKKKKRFFFSFQKISVCL
jgi:hypothetical protein